ncbi:MAG: cytochrome c-type biogenesis protein CcmH [Betaproteobacteria bacterium]
MKALLAALMIALSTSAFAQADEVANPDPAVEQRLKDLGEELRCLVCQNQTIADSNAPLALDLRNQIRTQVKQGKSDDEIRDYMTARYGDFVLYKPPFKATTAILWIGPFALVALGLLVFLFVIRRRRPPPAAAAVPQERRAQIEALLDESGRAETPRGPPRKDPRRS